MENMKKYAFTDGDLIRHVIEGENKEDVAPVVRCKDCKYYKESPLLAPNRFCFRLRGKDGNPIGYNFSADDFCSRGERKDGDEK